MKYLIIFICLLWVLPSHSAKLMWDIVDTPETVVEVVEIWWGFAPETMIKVGEVAVYDTDINFYEFDNNEYQIPSYFGTKAANRVGTSEMSETVLWNKFMPLKVGEGHIEYGVDREPPAIPTGLVGEIVTE